MGFKGGFAAFVDGYQRSSEAAANRARMEAQDKRAEESAEYQRTRDAAQDKRVATDDAYREEMRSRERKGWAEKDNLDKIERDTRAEPDAASPGATPAATPVAPVNTSANYNPAGPSLSSPSMAAIFDKIASVPTGTGLTPYDKEMRVAKRLAQAAGGYERAQAIIARAKTARDEGLLNTLSHLEANDPQAAWEDFNSSGAARMPPGSKFVQDGKSKDPYTGVEKPTWKLVGQDGTVINPDIRSSVYAHVFTPKERITMEAGRANNDAKLEMAKEKLEQAKFLAQMRAANAGNRAAAGGANGAEPIWNEKADAFLQDNFKSKNPESGQVDFDGGGFQFAQEIALGVSRRNGGNTAAATAYAIKADNALKVLAQGNPEALAALRLQAMNDMKRAVLSPTSQAMSDRTEQELLASKNKK